jgi:hypothetical protein
MQWVFKSFLSASLLGLCVAQAGAATLTDISFISNGGSFINDTVVGDSTSPLAFTANTGLNQPFLNAADSTISLGLGSYYAISFLGFGAHVGPGLVQFRVDGGPLISQTVTFPNPSSASSVFANFTLSGGQSVTIASTGLSADRIRIVADGGGLQGDGTPDAFYAFNYTNAVPEPASGAMLACGLAAMGLLAKRSRR